MTTKRSWEGLKVDIIASCYADVSMAEARTGNFPGEEVRGTVLLQKDTDVDSASDSDITEDWSVNEDGALVVIFYPPTGWKFSEDES